MDLLKIRSEQINLEPSSQSGNLFKIKYFCWQERNGRLFCHLKKKKILQLLPSLGKRRCHFTAEVWDPTCGRPRVLEPSSWWLLFRQNWPQGQEWWIPQVHLFIIYCSQQRDKPLRCASPCSSQPVRVMLPGLSREDFMLSTPFWNNMRLLGLGVCACKWGGFALEVCSLSVQMHPIQMAWKGS